MSTLDAEIERLSRRVAEDPRSTAFVALAEALRRAGRHVEGLQVLREGFRVHADHAPGRVVLARIHLDLGRRAVAMSVLEEVVRADVGNVAAGATLARLLLEEGRVADATPIVERLQQAAGSDGAVGEVLLLLRATQAAGAIRGEDAFDDPALADRLARRGYPRQALGIYRRVLAVHPDNPGISARVAELEEVERAAAAPAANAAEGPPPAARGPLAGYVRALWSRP